MVPSINITKDFSRWTEIIEFLSGKKYIQFLFNSENSCGALKNFTSYYYNCTKLSSLATFESVVAPIKNNGTKRVIGQCVANSKSLTDELPYTDCTWDGTGTVVGSCICNKGFTNISSQCIVCDVTEFKTADWNVPCEKCGTDSTADNNRLSCLCKKNFYREKGKEREYKNSRYYICLTERSNHDFRTTNSSSSVDPFPTNSSFVRNNSLSFGGRTPGQFTDHKNNSKIFLYVLLINIFITFFDGNVMGFINTAVVRKTNLMYYKCKYDNQLMFLSVGFALVFLCCNVLSNWIFIGITRLSRYILELL